MVDMETQRLEIDFTNNQGLEATFAGIDEGETVTGTFEGMLSRKTGKGKVVITLSSITFDGEEVGDIEESDDSDLTEPETKGHGVSMKMKA